MAAVADLWFQWQIFVKSWISEMKICELQRPPAPASGAVGKIKVSGRSGRKTVFREPKNPLLIKNFSARWFPASRRDQPETA
jgi:hypothetical protein